MTTGRRTAVAGWVLSTALLTSSCGFSLQNASFATGVDGLGGSGTRITAVFNDIGQLPIGGKVRMGQAEIGRVASIRTRDFQAIVDLTIDPNVHLPADTQARLELISPLGEEYVMLQPPERPQGNAMLTDGSVIPVRNTTRGPDMENTLAAVGALVNGSGIDQARTIVTELNTALNGREQKIRDLLSQLRQVLTSLDQHRADITRAIDSMHAVSGQLAQNRPTLEAAFTQIRPALDDLLSQRQQFATLLANTASLSTAAKGLVSQTDGSLTRQIHELGPVLKDLRTFDGNLGSTLAGLQRFSQLFQKATPGDYLLFNGTLDVPGSLAQLLNPARQLSPTRQLNPTPQLNPAQQGLLPPPNQGGAGGILEGGTR